MATSTTPEVNGTELSPAELLMRKHHVAVEEIPDEDDVKHSEEPIFASVLESATDESTTPGWIPQAAGKQKVSAPPKALDTSAAAFPSLGGAAPKPTESIWIKDGGAPNGSAPVKAGKTNGNGVAKGSTPSSGTSTPAVRSGAKVAPNKYQELLKIARNQVLPRTELKKPLPELLKDLNKKSRAIVELSSTSNDHFFFVATGPEASVKQILSELSALICVKRTEKISIPASARAHIIGKQGSKIKELQELTRARIQLPKADGKTVNGAEEDEEATVEVTIEGDQVAVRLAKAEIAKIAGERTATSTAKLRDVPAEFYPFIAGAHNSNVHELEDAHGVQINVPKHHRYTTAVEQTDDGAPVFLPAAGDNVITIAGDRSSIAAARAQIEKLTANLHQRLALDTCSIEPGRHQFVIGDMGLSADAFLEKYGCAIVLPHDDAEEDIALIGPAELLEAAKIEAHELSQSIKNAAFDPAKYHKNAPGGTSQHVNNIARYLRQRKEIERLEATHTTKIFTPLSQGQNSQKWTPFARDGANAMRAQAELVDIIRGHPPARMANVSVDPFFHRHLERAISPAIKEQYGVHLVVPALSEASAPLLLVYEGPASNVPQYEVPRGVPTQDEIRAFQKGLEEARNHILDIIKAQAEITSESIEVEPKFQDKLRKFILKEQQSRASHVIPVRVSNAQEIVTFRGPAPSVEALTAKVADFLEQAAQDEKERGYTMSFDFPQKYANFLIGKGGAHISELREKFDVEIQVNDGQVELKGPKAKAEAAKAHINSLGRQWADEVNHILIIEPQYHRELIGTGGSTIKKLQDRYKVQIHFPRSAKPAKDDANADVASDSEKKPVRRDQGPNEVNIKGPKKGADEARDEILSLLQYNKDNSFTATVAVQQRQLPSLIGQKGSEMDQLRQVTGAKIDLPNRDDSEKDPSQLVEVQIKGTKSQVAQAKKLIEEKKSIFDSTVTKTLDVDKKYHRALIGPGGSVLRDTITKAGGSDDRRELARTVQFPKSESDGNVIKIENTSAVVDKIIKAMEKIVSELQSQISETIEVPESKHRSLIGSGGQIKKDLEAQFRVTLDVPRQGSGKTGVKISGLPADVEQAKTHILELTKEAEGEAVQVPRKVHHAVAGEGQFFRKLKSEHKVSVDHAGEKPPPKPSAPISSFSNSGPLPLITDEVGEDEEAKWVTFSNSDSDIEGEIPWILRGSPENIAKAKLALSKAIEQALQGSFTGHLTLPDPQSHRYVVGQGGSKVNHIRKSTGTKVTVPRDQGADAPIEITGSEAGIEEARKMILEAVVEGIKANAGRSS